jgi:hypothetical protein
MAVLPGGAVRTYLYGNKTPSGYFPYFFNLGPGLLLASMGFLALVRALTNAFRKQWRRALAWFLRCVFSGGSCALGFFPVVLVVGASIAHDGRQNE